MRPTSLDFGRETVSLPARVGNGGPDALQWEAIPDQSWITVEPCHGGVAGCGEEDIRINVHREGLPPGEYRGSVDFRCDWTQESTFIWVEMSVPPAGGGRTGGYREKRRDH